MTRTAIDLPNVTPSAILRRIASAVALGTTLFACAGPEAARAPAIDVRGPSAGSPAAGATQGVPDALSAAPAALPFPPLPAVAREGEARAPAPRALERDGWVVDRFTAEGQSVRYPFEARAGELSLFELATWGYARGWSSTARIRILDPRGKVLLDEARPGKVVYRPFVAFVAPESGLFVYELRAEVECFRYTLVRHSSYPARDAGHVLALGEASNVHSYLAGAEDRARFTVRLSAGEEVAFKVQGSRPEAREEARARPREEARARRLAESERRRGAGVERERGADSSMRRPTGMESERRTGAEPGMESERRMDAEPPMEPGMDASMERSSARAPSNRQFQAFHVLVALRGEPLAPPAHYVRFTAPEEGDYEVVVAALDPGDGGLFDLLVERGLTLHAVRGAVVGPDDELLAGAELRFLREPDLDCVATLVSSAAGEYAARVPPGSYRIRIARPGGEPHEVLALVEEDRALDLLVP